MIRSLALLCFLLFPTLTYAELESQFQFIGQNAELLKAEKEVEIIRPETVQVPSTCYRQVPYESYECRDVTRYRQECSWVPESQRCWNETDRVCRPVQRYRQECSTSPSRRVCTNRPNRRVCTERPTRRVCTTRPDGRQHCTTVGGGQHCTTVGGGQECSTVPGQRTCRTVSYTDQDCDNVVRRRCETVPGRNQCSSIPYTENVCGMETNYRTESYACTKTEVIQKKYVKKIISETDVQIITNGLVESFPVLIKAIPASKQFKDFSLEVKLLAEPQVLVVLKKKEVKVESESATEIILRSEVTLEVLDRSMLPLAFPASIAEASIDEKNEVLTITFEGELSGVGSVDFTITHDTFFTRLKTIASLKEEYPGDRIEVGQMDGKAALNINLKGLIKHSLHSKNMLLKLKLGTQLALDGELLNAKKPEEEKTLESVFVELK